MNFFSVTTNILLGPQQAHCGTCNHMLASLQPAFKPCCVCVCEVPQLRCFWNENGSMPTEQERNGIQTNQTRVVDLRCGMAQLSKEEANKKDDHASLMWQGTAKMQISSTLMDG